MTPELQNTLVHVAERKKALDALRPMAPDGLGTGSGAPPFRFPWTEPRFASQL